MIDEDKLKSKIEGLKSNLIHGACSSQIAMETRCKEEAYNEVLTILNSMQKEPNLSNVERTVKNWKEEPVSEDFETEWKEYFKYRGNMATVNIKDLARHFAEWQKQQMMAKAVDGEIGYWNIRGLSVNMDLPRTLEEDDKVKLIIIKEDKV